MTPASSLFTIRQTVIHMSFRLASRLSTLRTSSILHAAASGKVCGSSQPHRITSQTSTLLAPQTVKVWYTCHAELLAWLTSIVNATVSSSGNSTSQVKIEIVDRNSSTSIATHTGTVNTPFTFSVPSVSPWSPDSPTLYNITVSLGDDEVGSYTGFRTVSRGIINGIQRPLLNGEFIFPFGTLDQGFW